MLTSVTIAKNEESNIVRMIKSLEGLVDSVIVVDTGSSDDTVDVARNMGATVFHSDWVNFGHNLTEAMAFASEGSDWLLRFDADMVIEELHQDFYSWLHKYAIADAYNVTIQEAGAIYRLPLLVNGKVDWNYVGTTHEYLNTVGRQVADVSGLVVSHLADGSNRATKFHRDIELLANEVEVGEPRAIFYTAESYRCLGDYVTAFEYFLRRSLMSGTWEEERWYAQYRAACCMLQIDPQRGVPMLVAAWRARPSRSEPLMRIREFCDSNRIQDISSDALFVEPSAYR